MPLWHKEDFELEADENQQMQKDAFLEPPSPDLKQKHLKNGYCRVSPLPGEIYGHKKMEALGQGGPAQTNITPLVSLYIYLPTVCYS